MGGAPVEENTAMKALKDAEFDQRYIFECRAYLPPQPYMYKYPHPFNFTDGWMQIQNAFQHLMGAVAVETMFSASFLTEAQF